MSVAESGVVSPVHAYREYVPEPPEIVVIKDRLYPAQTMLSGMDI
jgi:hypothetical protein